MSGYIGFEILMIIIHFVGALCIYKVDKDFLPNFSMAVLVFNSFCFLIHLTTLFFAVTQ